MILNKPQYKAFDVIILSFKVAPLSTCFNLLFTLIHATLPVAGLALATANFVDTATAVLQGYASRSAIYSPLVLLLLVLIFMGILGSVGELFITHICLRLRQSLNPAMVRRHAALDFKHIENADSWEIISRVTRNPAEDVLDGYGGFTSFIRIVISVVSFFVLIVSQVWWAALVILAFSIPMFWLSIWIGKERYQSKRDSEKFNRRTDYLEDVLSSRENIDERRLFGYGQAVAEDWQQQYDAGRILQMKVIFKTFLISKVSSLMLVAIALLVALTLISPVINGDLSAGMFMGIVAAVFGIVQDLGWQLSTALRRVSQAGEYMKDLAAFTGLSASESVLDEADATAINFTSLEFINVRFKYPSGQEYILDGLSFSLESGKHYAFVGKNGAGKTTITKLLTGLYTDYEGEILINGKELREYSASALKAMFSVVYQDFARYYISFEDNIALGNMAQRERAAEIAEAAGLDDVVENLPDGLASPLGRIKEGGQDISGGQWQRVAIARSIISKAPVKILDEPTAALDPISESKVYQEFEKLMQGKTTIFISHRLGSTKLADEILVIDNGQITERGSHDDLITAAGTYASMFESQRGWYQ